MCVIEFQVIKLFERQTKQGMGMMNDRLALGSVVRDASLKRQYLGQEMNKKSR